MSKLKAVYKEAKSAIKKEKEQPKTTKALCQQLVDKLTYGHAKDRELAEIFFKNGDIPPHFLSTDKRLTKNKYLEEKDPQSQKVKQYNANDVLMALKTSEINRIKELLQSSDWMPIQAYIPNMRLEVEQVEKNIAQFRQFERVIYYKIRPSSPQKRDEYDAVENVPEAGDIVEAASGRQYRWYTKPDLIGRGGSDFVRQIKKCKALLDKTERTLGKMEDVSPPPGAAPPDPSAPLPPSSPYVSIHMPPGSREEEVKASHRRSSFFNSDPSLSESEVEEQHREPRPSGN